MSPARTGLFALAEHLHMTVADVEQRMTLAEYLEWCQYLTDKPKPGQASAVNLADATQADLARMFPP